MTGKMEFHVKIPLEQEGKEKVGELGSLFRGREGSIMLQKRRVIVIGNQKRKLLKVL